MAADTAQVSLLAVLPKWWKLARLWFTGPEKWKARGYAAAVVVLAFLTTSFYVWISYAQKAFSTALSGKDVAGFHRAIGTWVVIICIAAPFFSFTLWVEDRMVLAWRAYLTRTILNMYFKDNAYFSIKQPEQVPQEGESPGQLTTDRPAAPVVDNPDQRICDDIGGYVRASTDIALSLIKKILNCAAFAGVLWGISPPLVYFMFAYAGIGTILTTSFFGRVLASLYNRILSQEGDLRFALVRVSMMAESIAFYDGTPAEARAVKQRFTTVLKTLNARIRWSALFDLWTRVYDYATILAPSIITAPRYFRGEIEFGTISQASYAFSSISSALAIIITNLTAITGLAAQTERLERLVTALLAHHEDSDLGYPEPAAVHMDKKHSDPMLPVHMAVSPSDLGPGVKSLGGGSIQREVSALPGLRLSQLTVVLPGSHHAICQNLNLELQPGQSLLIVGPSGVGKSSLLRAIAGLWKRGRGTVQMPSDAFFLPQKPFMPHLGTFRQQLLFPSVRPSDRAQGDGYSQAAGSSQAASHSGSGWVVQGSGGLSLRRRNSEPECAYSAGGKSNGHGGSGSTAEMMPLLGGPHGDSTTIQGVDRWSARAVVRSDQELTEKLTEVQLGSLLDRLGGLDAECDWTHMLSPGQQQRVAVVRLLLHQPSLAFLDEATSAVDEATEALLYKMILGQTACVVSVGHRAQLIKYHTHVLEAKPQQDGIPSWTLYPSSVYAEQHGVR